MYLNRVQLIGFTGKNAESRNIRNTHKVSFSLATSESWQDENSNWQKRTEWHNCVVWGGKLAEVAAVLESGSYLLVEGKLTKRDYEREVQAGRGTIKVPATAVEIIVTRILKLGRPAKENSSESDGTVDESEEITGHASY